MESRGEARRENMSWQRDKALHSVYWKPTIVWEQQTQQCEKAFHWSGDSAT